MCIVVIFDFIDDDVQMSKLTAVGNGGVLLLHNLYNA